MTLLDRIAGALTKQRLLLAMVIFVAIAGAGAGYFNLGNDPAQNPPAVSTSPPNVVEARVVGDTTTATLVANSSETVTVDFDGTPASTGDLGLTELQVSFTERTNLTLNSVQQSASPPTTAEPPSEEDPIGYVSIDHSPVAGAIDTVTLEFQVARHQLAERGIEPSELAVFRYTDGKWTELETAIVDTSGSSYVIEAESPGLSVFAIGRSASSTPTPTQTQTPTTASVTTTTPPESTTATTVTSTTPDSPPQASAGQGPSGTGPPENPGNRATGSLTVSDPPARISDRGTVWRVSGRIDGSISWNTASVDGAVLVVQSRVPGSGWDEVRREAITTGSSRTIDLGVVFGSQTTYVSPERAVIYTVHEDGVTRTRRGTVSVTTVLYDGSEPVRRVVLVDGYTFDVTNNRSRIIVDGGSNATAN